MMHRFRGYGLLLLIYVALGGCSLWDSPKSSENPNPGKPRRGAITWESGE